MKLRTPDLTTVFLTGKAVEIGKINEENDGVSVDYRIKNDGMHVLISSALPLRWLRARWNFTESEKRKEPIKILGDAWERGYGDLEWRGINHTRCMPWYFLVSNSSDSDSNLSGRFTEAFGVAVQPRSICSWQYDDRGITLFLDLRCGGAGTELRGRTLDAATVIFSEYRDVSAFEAGKRFCREMSPVALTTEKPVYGSNNWYYAYGKSSREEILSDSDFVSRMTKGLSNRPFMVIDDGWQKNMTDAPWENGNGKFGDMGSLAEEMKARDVIPGIWVRYLADIKREAVGIKDEWRLSRDPRFLDPSRPEIIEYVKETTRRIVGWGYKLIKHDYSTYDIFGRWGFDMPCQMTHDGWSFADTSRTSAEIILDFYHAVKESSGDAVIIGCNCISHLTAGLAHLNRTGDDTSGREWNRTRKMGVNTLAFRQTQNGAFYAADADCVGITGAIPWSLNREWLRALSRSGSPLFVSCKPGILSPAEEEELKEAFRYASAQKDDFYPLDWMETVTPSDYILNGEKTSFSWYDDFGSDDFKPGI